MLFFNTPLQKNQDPTFLNTTLKFTRVDSEELYNENLIKFGPTWYYANKEIVYNFNSLGYRSKELDYYKDKEFILVLGCSHSVGIGLSENDIWHSYLGEELGIEILNAGIEGTGPDIQLLNSILFLKNSGLKPKMVIVQWPDLDRFTFKGDHNFIPLLPGLFNFPHSSSVTKKLYTDIVKTFFPDNIKSFYHEWLQKNNSTNNSKIFIETTRLLWKLSGVAYYDFSINQPDSNYSLDNYKHLMTDLARDQIHHGPRSHKNLSSEIYKKILL